MKDLTETLAFLALLFFAVIVMGEPDILDGWIKRANDIRCEPEVSSQ